MSGSSRFLTLSIAVLLLAGIFALALVVARMPPFDGWITDPLLARRCLVVHVSLSLIVWFHAFTAGLTYRLVPQGQGELRARVAVGLAAAGVVLMGAAAALPGSAPILSNYLPRIDHPLFSLGQIVFGAGVIAAVLDRRLFVEPPKGAVVAAAIPGLRAAALLLVVAASTFASSAMALPGDLPPEARAELLYWGGGHVLQASSVAAMLSVWCMLLHDLTGRSPVSRPVANALFFVLTVPWLASPLLPFLGVTTGAYVASFTTLMRFAIFPPTLVFAALCIASIVRARREGAFSSWLDPRVAGFAASVALTLLGFVLGAAIRGSTTMIPAHYHANIGAVTVAFMAVAPIVLLRTSEGAARPSRWVSLQPAIYGVGQLVFAAGFALARSSRKVYGVEQAGRGALETAGLVVMGVGGLVAAAGGLLFLSIFIRSWLAARAGAPSAGLRRKRWTHTVEPHASPSRG